MRFRSILLVPDPDTDDDGVGDGEEFSCGADPADPASTCEDA